MHPKSFTRSSNMVEVLNGENGSDIVLPGGSDESVNALQHDEMCIRDRHRCVLVRNSKYGVVAENNDELEYY